MVLFYSLNLILFCVYPKMLRILSFASILHIATALRKSHIFSLISTFSFMKFWEFFTIISKPRWKRYCAEHASYNLDLHKIPYFYLFFNEKNFETAWNLKTLQGCKRNESLLMTKHLFFKVCNMILFKSPVFFLNNNSRHKSKLFC